MLLSSTGGKVFIKGANNEHETFNLKEFPFKQKTN